MAGAKPSRHQASGGVHPGHATSSPQGCVLMFSSVKFCIFALTKNRRAGAEQGFGHKKYQAFKKSDLALEDEKSGDPESQKGSSCGQHECLHNISQQSIRQLRYFSIYQSRGPIHRPTLSAIESKFRRLPKSLRFLSWTSWTVYVIIIFYIIPTNTCGVISINHKHVNIFVLTLWGSWLFVQNVMLIQIC